MKTNPMMEKVRQTEEYKKAASDLELAKEYSKRLVESSQGRCDKYTRRLQQFDGYDLEDAYENGLRKGRELESEKAMRFAEWTSGRYIYFSEKWRKQFIQHGETYVEFTTEELYNSQEFLDYLKQFEI